MPGLRSIRRMVALISTASEARGMKLNGSDCFANSACIVEPAAVTESLLQGNGQIRLFFTMNNKRQDFCTACIVEDLHAAVLIRSSSKSCTLLRWWFSRLNKVGSNRLQIRLFYIFLWKCSKLNRYNCSSSRIWTMIQILPGFRTRKGIN